MKVTCNTLVCGAGSVLVTRSLEGSSLKTGVLRNAAETTPIEKNPTHKQGKS